MLRQFHSALCIDAPCIVVYNFFQYVYFFSLHVSDDYVPIIRRNNCIYATLGTEQWAGQRSRYSDWLRAGRSGDRIPVGARFSAPVQTDPGTHPVSCKMCTGSFPGVKSGRGVTLTPHPLLVPLVMKEQSYTSTTPMGRTACTEPQCLYKSDLYPFFTYMFWATMCPSSGETTVFMRHLVQNNKHQVSYKHSYFS